MKRVLPYLLSFATACAGTSPSDPVDAPIESIVLEVPSPIMVGGTARVTATLLDASQRILVPRAVSFSSSDENIAIISAAGIVFGRAQGSTVIIVRAGKKEAQGVLQVDLRSCIETPWDVC